MCKEVDTEAVGFRVFSREFSRFFAVTLTTIFYFFVSPPAFACPLCKEAVSKMGEIWTAVGFNWSIYFMIAVPFLLVGAFTGALYWNYRKRHRA